MLRKVKTLFIQENIFFIFVKKEFNQNMLKKLKQNKKNQSQKRKNETFIFNFIFYKSILYLKSIL
jgi:hypothetical protein